MKKKCCLVIVVFAALLNANGQVSGQSKLPTSLIPLTPSKAPDYFCTWNIQGYVSNYTSAADTRTAMTAQNIFGNGRWQNWAGIFERLHKDLYLVLDDAWDTPLATGDKNYYGSLIPDSARFPSFGKLPPAQRFSALSQQIKQSGWKGLGLWICAQQAPAYISEDSVTYWKERLEWMEQAGIKYWKVDWGKRSKNAAWREWITKLGHQYAPGLTIEQAMTPSVLTSAAVYRTYDVENVIAVPHTIDRIGKLLTQLPKGQAISIINCEDEPYIAAGTGAAIGIMRHPFNGNLPDGKQDHAFPPVGRDLKSRQDEVVRCVMWHRIALPFGISDTNNYVDTVQLYDNWVMKAEETYIKKHGEGYINSWQAPAIIARGLEKPVVTLLKGDTLLPYVLACKYPNGAVAIAAIGRTIGRSYITPRANVLVKIPQNGQPIGIFGCYNTLSIQVEKPISYTKILAQDLAGNTAEDITSLVKRSGNTFTLPGDVIERVGLSAAAKGDKSEPGMVIVFQK